MNLLRVHHIALITADYVRAKRFYVDTLGLVPLREVYRAERDSYKLDLAVGDTYQLELFSFPNPPLRPSQPEAAGLRHLCFAVTDVVATRTELLAKAVACEAIRVDEHTGRRFFFIADPDGLPIEFYEA